MFRALFGLVIYFFLSVLAPASSAQTLVLAQLSDRPKKDYKQLRPMVEFAAEKLAHLGITEGEVKLYSEPNALVDAIRNGKVHWVTETPYTASILVNEAGADPLLMKWKSNQRRYQTLIYTHIDSPIKSLHDLKGAHIAFEHNTSFSSYFLPRMLIEKEGLAFNKLENFRDLKENDKVNFTFSRNEKNNLLWVHKRIVDAGALNNGDWENTKRVPKALKSDLRIIYRSDFYPRAIELVSPQLSQDIREGLRELLLGLSPEENSDLLYRYENTGGFEKLEPSLTQTLEEIYTYRQRFTR